MIEFEEYKSKLNDLKPKLEELRAACAERGIETKPEWAAGKLVAELYDELGEDTIVNPTFVCDYPIEVSPLAKRSPKDKRLTERFELRRLSFGPTPDAPL